MIGTCKQKRTQHEIFPVKDLIKKAFAILFHIANEMPLLCDLMSLYLLQCAIIIHGADKSIIST